MPPGSVDHRPSLAKYIVGAETGLFLLLATRVFTSPGVPVYDERHSFPNIALFHQYGATKQYLLSLTHASGPLYGVFYGLFTQGSPRALRFLTCALLVVFCALIAVILKSRGARFPIALAAAAIAVPPIWVSSGIALDEPLALMLAAAGLLLIADGAGIAGCAMGGLAIGLAALTRQPLILAAFAAPLAALSRGKPALRLLLVPAIALLLLAPELLVWKGLTPPLAERAFGQHLGFAPAHALLSFGYAGALMFVIAPGFLIPAKRSVIGSLITGSLIAGILLNILFWQESYSPGRGLLSFVAGEDSAFMHVYGLACGGMVLSAGIFFAVCIVARTLQTAGDSWRLTTHIALLLMLAWPGAMQLQFSSRYVVMALPWLILAAQPYFKAGLFTLIRLLAGGLAGAAVLSSYYTLSR